MSNPPLGAPIVLGYGIFGFGQLEVAGLGDRITSGLYRMPCVRKAMWSPNRHTRRGQRRSHNHSPTRIPLRSPWDSEVA